MSTEPPPSHGDSPGPDQGTTSRGPSALGTGARATGRGLGRAAKAVGRGSRYTVRQAQRAARAEGAEQSGLSRLIEMHAASAAGDAAVAIALASTVFFVQPGEARGQVALFLGLTMLPFAIVAPLIGPFLDRFSHGRRWAIGGTFALRAFLCWVLADAIASDSALFYPAALGVLVCSKAYGVTRAAAVPRLLPDNLTLVKGNGRVSLAGIIGAAVSAPLAGGAAYFGAEWALRYGFVVFVIGTILAIKLPEKVDSSAGEAPMTMFGGQGRRGTRIPPPVSFALRANCGPRWLSGFLTMFMAFLLMNPDFQVEGWFDSRRELLVGLVIGAAGAGNTLGIAAASVVRRINPAITVMAALVADAVMVLVAAVIGGVPTLVLLGLTAGLAQSLAKLSLDSTIQQHVPVRVHASAFARSDTTLQLAWVAGGFVGIALPPDNRLLGLIVAGVVLGAWTVFVLGSRRVSRVRAGAPAPASEEAARPGPV